MRNEKDTTRTRALSAAAIACVRACVTAASHDGLASALVCAVLHSIRGWLVSACSRTRQPWLVGLLGGVLAWLGTGTNTVLTWGTALAHTALATAAAAAGRRTGHAKRPWPRQTRRNRGSEAVHPCSHPTHAQNLAHARARNDDARFDSQGSSDIPPGFPPHPIRVWFHPAPCYATLRPLVSIEHSVIRYLSRGCAGFPPHRQLLPFEIR